MQVNTDRNYIHSGSTHSGSPHRGSPDGSSTDRHYVDVYHFDQSKVCYCGSGRNFGECCYGGRAPDKPPEYIQIFNNYVDQAQCKSLLRFVKKQSREWLMVVDPDRSGGGVVFQKRDPARVSQKVDIGKKSALVAGWIDHAVRRYAAQAGFPEWFEQPQLLRYSPGGKYDVHADAEESEGDGGRFFRRLDRDFSLLIYLNDDYEGGELHFNALNFTYKPKMGDLILFPSNHVFGHESRPVISGIKYAIVSWGAFKGTPRVGGVEPGTKIFIR